MANRYDAWNKRYKLGQYAPQPTARPPAKPAAAAPGDGFRTLLAQLASGPVSRTETEWANLLDPRVKPFTDSIDAATNAERARSEYRFESQAAANQGLGNAFLQTLTGGKTGDEAAAFTKENFGGSYLGAQAMSMAHDALKGLTSDWEERDWQISGEYLKAMQQVPAIREELRANIEKDDVDDFTRKFQTATLLLDETYRQAQLREDKRQFGVKTAEEKRQFNTQIDLARGELGIDAVNAQSGQVRAATGAKNAEIRDAELALKKAKQSYAASKDAASRRLAQQRIDISREALRLQQQKARQEKAGGGSAAQKAETGLAIDILQDRDTILGTVRTKGLGKGAKRDGAMTYTEAYDYVYGLAEAAMPTRQPAYINSWVKKRLKALGLGKVDPKPRGG